MTTGERSTEARIEQLVEIEQELKRDSSEDEARGVYERGRIAGAERIPAEEMPDDHPVTVDSEQVLRIDVATDGGIVETYIEWAPHKDGEGHIDLLLNALGRGPEEFANIFGDEVALTYQDGYHGIDADATAKMRRTGIPDLGIDLSFLPSISVPHSGVIVAGLVGVLAVLTILSQEGFERTESLYNLITFIAVPLSIAIDASRVKKETRWNPITPVWAIGAFIPVFNVPVSTAYLVRRYIAKSANTGRVPVAWLYAIGFAGLVSLVTLALLSSPSSTVTWVFASIFIPLAIYFDFEHVDTDSRKTMKRAAWTVVAAGFSVLFMGFIPAVVYLIYRLR